MNRRTFLGVVIAAVSLGSPALARDYADDVLRQLRRNGYDVVSVTRTMLGRTRIRATKSGGEREIILNAATGEILRDVWIAGGAEGGLWDADDAEDAAEDNAEREEEEREDREDREEDEREDRDKEDNSGKGSGGSGSGSGSGSGGDGDDDDD